MAIYAGRPISGSSSVMEQPANLASEKQVAFAWKLLNEKSTDGAGDLPGTQAELAAMHKRTISFLIDFLMALPRKASVVAAEVGPGFYKRGDDFYKVNTSKSSGRNYALRWDGAHWDYEGGMGVYRTLTADMKLTAEDAKAFGDEYHACVFCSTQLTDQRSITAGYGPICAGKNGLPWG